jgi:hypothetical protein
MLISCPSYPPYAEYIVLLVIVLVCVDLSVCVLIDGASFARRSSRLRDVSRSVCDELADGKCTRFTISSGACCWPPGVFVYAVDVAVFAIGGCCTSRSLSASEISPARCRELVANVPTRLLKRSGSAI